MGFGEIHMTNQPRRAISIVWMVVIMTALIAIVSFAIDYGRAQLAKTELRRAADAAARAAGSSINNVAAAQQLAVDYGKMNNADGIPVVIDPAADVEFGTWDTSKRTFTALSGAARSSANAVRVWARRTSARGNPLPLTWGALIGAKTCDVQAFSTVAVAPENYGVVGLNSITMSGNTTDSYWSNGASGSTEMGNIASNGSITLAGGATIHGNVRGATVTGGTVTGNTAPLSAPLTFPNGDAGAYATVNDNGLVPGWCMNGVNFQLSKNQSVTLPGGHYYFNNFSTATGSQITFTGPTTIYCYGNFSMTGQTITNGNLPKNLQLIMCPGPTGLPPGSVSITAGAALYANVYAPQSAVTIGGGGAIYGSVLGLTVSMSGSASIHYDMALKGTGGMQIVQ
jgi:Flp pilus assembly protein TadG